MTTNPTTLARYAKAIAAMVEAGCEIPTSVRLSGYQWVLRVMGAKPSIDQQQNPLFIEAVIAVLEKYVREDVVVWAELFGFHIEMPTWKPDAERWHWCVGSPFTEGAITGTEAHIAFLEAIASVVAGEKGEVG